MSRLTGVMGWTPALQELVDSVENLESFNDFDINVLDYGALGNGTHDDTTAIQAALTAASGATGLKVFFPAGTYKVTATLTVSETVGIQIIGVSRSSVIIQPTSALAGLPILKLTNVRDSLIESITFGGVASPNYPLCAVQLHRDAGSVTATNNTLRDILIGSSFTGFTDGVRMTCSLGNDTNNDQHKLDGCVFRNISGKGVFVGHSNSLAHTVFNTVFDTCDTGIYTDSGSIRVESCWFYCSTYDFQFGMDAAQTQYHPHLVINCGSESNAKILKVLASSTEVYFSGYSRQGGTLASANVIDFQSQDGTLVWYASRFQSGQLNQTCSLGATGVKAAFALCRLGFTHYSGGTSGYLRMTNNNHDPGTVDISGLNSTCLFMNMGEVGGGYTSNTITAKNFINNAATAGVFTSNIPSASASDEAWQIKSLNALTAAAGYNNAAAILGIYNGSTKAFKFGANGMLYCIGPANGSQPGLYYQSPSGGKAYMRLAGGSSEFVQLLGDGGISAIQIGTVAADLSITSTLISTTATLSAGKGLRANSTNTAKPTASSTYRGQLWYTEGGGGVADTVEICVKDAAGSYSWVSVT